MQLFLEFENVEELRGEVESSLSQGRAFVPGRWPLDPLSSCEVVVVHPGSGEWLPLAAEVVYCAEDVEGVGVAFVESTERLAPILRQFLLGDDQPDGQGSDALVLEPVADAPEPPTSSSIRPSRPDEEVVSSRPRVQTIYDRLRALSVGQRERVARRGNLNERKALERIYGAAVWEALLSNPLLTGPEVARIAKNGKAPQPIIATIASNSAWISKPEVRRALLSNPRLAGSHLDRVLRALPQPELRTVPKQTAYPAKVRAAARRLMAK